MRGTGPRGYSSETCCEPHTSRVLLPSLARTKHGQAGNDLTLGGGLWPRPTANQFKEGGMPKEEEDKSTKKCGELPEGEGALRIPEEIGRGQHQRMAPLTHP